MLCAAATTAATAQTVGLGNGMVVVAPQVERNGGYMAVNATFDLSAVKVKSDQAVLVTPRLVNGGDSIVLPPVGVYGRTRYYQIMRSGSSGTITNNRELSFRAPKLPDSVAYSKVVPYAAWMNGAKLVAALTVYGCCSADTGPEVALAGYAETPAWFPELVYVQPKGNAEKRRELRREAYIDFPVDKTDIYPDYRNNPQELAKIQASIDSVRLDSDITITSVWIKGYASPESPYAHNAYLARGRTAAIREHIGRLYHFADTIISTDYEPENWGGLRRSVENSNLGHRNEILAIIDSDLDPDPKEARIKAGYPEDYAFMLKNFYPALRRTEYRVEYVIRTFSNVEEIRNLMHTAPQKLSLEELYLAAQDLEPGSDEFTEVFETAVRMYPADTTANLNAANAAMRRDELDKAERYMARAGNSPEAIYARGAIAIRRKDYAAARRYLEKAEALGLEQAKATLDELGTREQ